jgi:beta-phosphoglucomutase-like phosphatase (HAD superfamily)
MSLRIGLDMDGVLADFLSAFRQVEVRLFGPGAEVAPGDPEEEEERQERGLFETRQRHRAIWREIEATENFWTTLEPLGRDAVRRLQALSLTHKWEVFFITQRPATAGETVQRQTQRWLRDGGFDLPSVLVVSGSRGAVVRALRLDYHVDDSMQHCLDVVADSTARTIFVTPDSSEAAIANARKLGMAPVSSIDQALDILEQATIARANPSMLQRLSALVGWR